MHKFGLPNTGTNIVLVLSILAVASLTEFKFCWAWLDTRALMSTTVHILHTVKNIVGLT